METVSQYTDRLREDSIYKIKRGKKELYVTEICSYLVHEVADMLQLKTMLQKLWNVLHILKLVKFWTTVAAPGNCEQLGTLLQ
jgi:hypothetical protein